METEYRANYYELEEEEAGDVDIQNYGPVYDDGEYLKMSWSRERSIDYGNRKAQPALIDEARLAAMQQQIAQEAAFAQIPNEVKRVSANPASLFR